MNEAEGKGGNVWGNDVRRAQTCEQADPAILWKKARQKIYVMYNAHNIL